MASDTKEAPDAANVQGLAESDSPESRVRVKAVETRDPIEIARIFRKQVFPNYWGGGAQLINYDGRWWSWTEIDPWWAPYESDEIVQDMIWRFLADLKYVSKDEDGKPKVVPWGPTTARVRDVERALKAELRRAVTDVKPGQYLTLPQPGTPHAKAGVRLVPFHNGLLSLDTWQHLEVTPTYFNTYCLPFSYDESAPEPVEWLRFLADVFEHEPEAIQALQQWFGYIVSGRTDLHKIFFIVGPTRSGKGTIASVLTALLGHANVAPSSVSALGQGFGLAGLIDKSLILMPDVRFDGVKSGATEVERLLEISGEDEIRIARKFLSDWTGVLPGRIVMMSNTTPVLRDVGGALPGRFEILTMRKSYLGREDTTLRSRLLAELPGIFNWALDGLGDLEEQDGRFARVTSGEETREEIRTMGSSSAAFIDELLVSGDLDTHRMTYGALADAQRWWAGRNGEALKARTVLGRDIKARFPEAKNNVKVRDFASGARETGWHGVALRCVTCSQEDSETLAARALNGKPVCEMHYSVESNAFITGGVR